MEIFNRQNTFLKYLNLSKKFQSHKINTSTRNKSKKEITDIGCTSKLYLCTSCVFFPVVLAPRQRSHLCSCLTVHSSGVFLGKVAPGTSSSFNLTISDLFLSFMSTIFSSFTAHVSEFASAMFFETRPPKRRAQVV